MIHKYKSVLYYLVVIGFTISAYSYKGFSLALFILSLLSFFYLFIHAIEKGFFELLAENDSSFNERIRQNAERIGALEKSTELQRLEINKSQGGGE